VTREGSVLCSISGGEFVVGRRESQQALTPTLQICVSDDPLNSTGVIKGNYVKIIQIHPTSD